MADISLAMRIKADVREATDGLREVSARATELGNAAKSGGAGVSQLTQRVSSQIKQIGELQDALSSGVNSLDELADKEQALDRAVAAGLISFDEQAKAIADLDKQAAKLNTRLAQQERAVQSVLRRFDPTSAALKQLARDERALSDAVSAGVITANQRNRALIGIGAERQRLQQVNDAVERGANSIGKFGLNSARAQQSIVSLGSALAAGNFSQGVRSLVSLGVATGTTSALFTAAAAAIALPIAALGVFGVAALKGARASEQLNRVLIASGGAIGVSTGALEDTISQLNASNDGFGKNRESMLGLIDTGRFVGDALTSATAAAVSLSDLTGKSVSETTGLIARLATEPTRAIVELNSKYRLLTTSVVAQISELERQGRTQDATRLATDELGRVTAQRVDEANAGLNTLDSELARAKRGWNAMWDAALNIGREQSLNDQIAEVQEKIVTLRRRLAQALDRNSDDAGRSGVISAAFEREINALIAQRTDLIRRNTAEIKAGQKAQDDAAVDAAGDAALLALSGELDNASSKSDRLKNALADVAKQFDDLRKAGVKSLRGLPLDQAQALVEQAKRKQFAETVPKAKADPSAGIIAGLERQLGLLGKNTEASRILFEIQSGGLKGASAETQQLAIDLAQLSDSEKTRLATEQQIAALTPQLLRDVGREAEASALDIENAFGALRRNLETFGDAGQLSLLDQALGIRAAKAELQTLQGQIDALRNAGAQREQTIQTQLQARLITEATARQQIADLQTEQADAVQALLPRMQALAEQTGSPEALARVQQITAELERQRISADLLTQTLITGFEQGLGGALTRLTEGTASLGQAAVGFVQDITRALAQLAAQQVAQSATTGILNLVRGSQPGAQATGGGAAEAAAITTATTTGAATLGTAITGASTAGATAIGGALTAGGTATATGIATGITGGGSIAASSMGIAITTAGTAAAAAMAAAITTANATSSFGGFAEGGFTGPGGKYQPAGIVHASEFVTRAAVVRQPGMLPLLSAINSDGMRAVQRLLTGSPLRAAPALPRHNTRIGYAEGGLVGGGAAAPTVQNRFRFVNIIDPVDMGRRFASTPDFERSVLNVISSNPRAVRQEIS